jgi:hypothetical protein
VQRESVTQTWIRNVSLVCGSVERMFATQACDVVPVGFDVMELGSGAPRLVGVALLGSRLWPISRRSATRSARSMTIHVGSVNRRLRRSGWR